MNLQLSLFSDPDKELPPPLAPYFFTNSTGLSQVGHFLGLQRESFS